MFRFHGVLLIMFLMLAVANTAFSENLANIKNEQSNEYIDKQKNLIDKVDLIDEKLKEVRRDQLNYKIEKDIVREVYSTNYQTINVIIAIVLGVFGFLGFFGLKDINGLKAKYDSELRKLGELKDKIEKDIEAAAKQQEKAKESLDKISATNEDQNRKIKLLELKEKIADLNKKRRYADVLEYCGVALGIDENDLAVLHDKAMAQLRLMQYSSAIQTYNTILKLDENDETSMSNMCELCLFVGDIELFKEYFAKATKYLTEEYGDLITSYLKILEAYVSGDNVRMYDLIKILVDKFEDNSKVKTDWSFVDFRGYLNKQKDSPEKDLLLELAKFLSGITTKDVFVERLAEQ